MKRKFIEPNYNLDDYVLVDSVECHSYLPVCLNKLIYRPLSIYVHRSGYEFHDVIMRNVIVSKFSYYIQIYVGLSEWVSAPKNVDLLPF